MSIERRPGSRTQGPHLAVDISSGWESESIEFFNTLEDRLAIYELIHELRDGLRWLEQQDPNEREYGPPAPPDRLMSRLLAEYHEAIKWQLGLQPELLRHYDNDASITWQYDTNKDPQ